MSAATFRRLVLSLVALVVAAAASPHTASAAAGKRHPTLRSQWTKHSTRFTRSAMTPDLPVGVYARLRGRTPAQMVSVATALSAAGVAFTREDVSWTTVERAPGRYDWTEPDQIIGSAARGNLTVMATVSGTPAWMNSAWNVAPRTADQTAAYAAFVRATVARYGASGSFWRDHPDIPRHPVRWFDIWNEPYTPTFWSTPDAVQYGRLFVQAVRAARPADPTAKFMLEANTSSFVKDAPPFLDQMLAGVPGILSYADGVGIHPYASKGWTPDRCSRPAVSRGASADARYTLYEVCRLEDVRRMLDAAGGRAVPLWLTELGWSTGSGPDSVTEDAQADRLRATFDLLRGRWKSIVAGVQWYSLQDQPVQAGKPADGYGLLHADGTPKPAWFAFLDALKQGG